MPLSYLIIFLTGAATLALELLSSRVLTPYFGVSLYIWSSILSITLTFLAIGYYGGGRLARRTDGAQRHFAFFAAPAISALAIVAACLIYPWLFPWLAGIDLVFGSVMAATVLLAVPLVVLSAMNPLLIAIRPEAAGDAGAGRVFFVSTIGSVAGVVATAFLLIPNVTNFRGLCCWRSFPPGLPALTRSPGAPPRPTRRRADRPFPSPYHRLGRLIPAIQIWRRHYRSPAANTARFRRPGRRVRRIAMNPRYLILFHRRPGEQGARPPLLQRTPTC